MKQITGNSGMVREVNRERIAQALRENGQTSIAELARTTGLSVATCSNLITELVESGEAEELPAESSGGRPAKLYSYNINNTLVASLLLRSEFGKAEMGFSVRNRNGSVLASGTDTHQSLTVREIEKLIRRLVRKFPAIKAAGVSIPGVVHDGEVEFCDIEELSGMNIERSLSESTGLKIVTENDMNFAAIGYYLTRRDEIRSSLAYVASPPGEYPGMGLVVNGALVKGKSNFAGEVSFLPLPGLERQKNPTGKNPQPLVSRMAFIIAAIVSVLNPDIVVLAGIGDDGEIRKAIRKQCLVWIPERHMPTIVLRHDFEEDSLSGMTAAAFNTLAPSINLVEKGPLWFAQGN